MNKHAGLATFARTLGPDIVKRVKSVPFARYIDELIRFGRFGLGKLKKAPAAGQMTLPFPKAPLKQRIGEYIKGTVAGERGMFGKGTREAVKGLVKKPWQTIKGGAKEMDTTEKLIMGGLTAEAIRGAGGKLTPGETRLGRVGSEAGRMAGYFATPYKRVGVLGNILVGDILGFEVGRLAGKGLTKATQVGKKAGKTLAQKLQEKGAKNV